jgi:capsule polysaccharide export protein KpsC/LpsZ
LGYKIIVKEHPSSLGYRPAGYYRKIEDIPNILLISPRVDSHSLIKNADAVIVLSGTTGWEALLHKVPVISFGESFYNDSGLANRCKNYNELPDILDKIKRTRNEDNDYDEAIKKFVAALHEQTYEGYFTIPKFDERVMTKENIKNIGEAIINEIKLKGK